MRAMAPKHRARRVGAVQGVVGSAVFRGIVVVASEGQQRRLAEAAPASAVPRRCGDAGTASAEVVALSPLAV